MLCSYRIIIILRVLDHVKTEYFLACLITLYYYIQTSRKLKFPKIPGDPLIKETVRDIWDTYGVRAQMRTTQRRLESTYMYI